MQQVTSTELQRDIGRIMSQAKREAITITNRGRPELVICDAKEYKRLKKLDTRRALYPHELGPEWDEVFEKGYQGPDTPELNHLLE